MGSTQIYLAVGIPMLTILVAVLVQLVAIFATRSSTEKQIAISFEGLGKRMDAFEDRMSRFERSLDDLRTTFVNNHTERLVRLEERVFPTAS